MDSSQDAAGGSKLVTVKQTLSCTIWCIGQQCHLLQS